MRHFIIILLLVLTSCKSETKGEVKTENESDKTVYQMWDNFIKLNPEFKKEELPESWYFHNNKADADRLAELTLSGKKTAMTTGLYSWYEEANADLPKIGTKHIVTDFDGKAKAIILIKMVDTIPFNQISNDFASMDMGTTNEPLKAWRKAHWDFIESVMEERGERPTEEMLLVFERFEVIWQEKE